MVQLFAANWDDRREIGTGKLATKAGRSSSNVSSKI